MRGTGSRGCKDGAEQITERGERLEGEGEGFGNGGETGFDGFLVIITTCATNTKVALIIARPKTQLRATRKHKFVAQHVQNAPILYIIARRSNYTSRKIKQIFARRLISSPRRARCKIKNAAK